MTILKFPLLVAAIAMVLTPKLTFGQTLKSEAPQILYQSGLEQLGQGNPWQASILLQDALSKYSTAGDHTGVLQTQIAQSELHHYLGQNLQACKILLSALDLKEKEVCTPSSIQNMQSEDAFNMHLQAIKSKPLIPKALANLSFYLSTIGNLEASQFAIQRAEVLSSAHGRSASDPLVILGKAHLENLFFHRNRNQALLDDSPLIQKQLQIDSVQHAQTAFSLYEKLARSSVPSISVKAKLSWAELYSTLNLWSQNVNRTSPLLAVQRRLQPAHRQIIDTLNRSSFDELPKSEAIYGRLRLAELQLVDRNLPMKTIYALAKESLQDARTLKNVRGQSFALGLLGQVYQRSNQPSEAQAFFRSAINQSQSVNAWDSAYRWQWMMGKSLAEEGKRDEALTHYRVSVQSLEHVRNELLAIDSELQFSFASEVAPVYREYIQLLLSESDTSDVDTALDTYNQLQLAELENYLRCGRLETVSVSEIKDAPPVLYIIELANQIEVILRKPNGQTVRHRPDNSVVRENISNLRYFTNGVQPKKLKLEASAVPISAIQSGKVLYQQLIRPIGVLQKNPQKWSI